MNWLDNLGDRNPQLLRELRSRWRGQNVGAAVGLTIVGQVLLLLIFAAMLPDETAKYSAYCLNRQIPCQTDWPKWWKAIFQVLSGVIPYVLYLSSVFLLVNDISQEAQRGTISFLRLSPRSAASIILGKLLGVPSLIGLAVLLLLPLHGLSALLGGLPLAYVLNFYLMLVAWLALLLLLTFVIGLGVGSQTRVSATGNTSGIAIAMLFALGGIPLVRLIEQVAFGPLWPSEIAPITSQIDELRWWGWPINTNFLSAHIFLLGNIGILTYWLWRVTQRLFRKPTGSILSKRQSYVFVAYFAILIAGFLTELTGSAVSGAIAILSSISIYGGLVLISLLGTSRQVVLDWLRGQREAAMVARSQNISPGQRRKAQITEWLYGEKSPGVTAVWINCLIVYGFLLLWLPSVPVKDLWVTGVGLLLTVLLVANYSLLSQLMFLLETPKRHAWAIGSLLVAIIVPSVGTLVPWLSPIVAYFTPFLWVVLVANAENAGNAGLGPLAHATHWPVVAIGIHMILLIFQTALLRRKLRQMARSL